jgi:transposase
MLEAIAGGEINRETLAALTDRGLRATQERLQDALGVCQELNPVYRRLIKMVLDEVASIDKRIEQLNQEMANLLRAHEDQVQRLAEVPGLGVDSAQQIIAEVGATAATFPSEKHLSSWVGACPGEEESAEVNHSRRSPQGNRHMRRILNQAANAAVKLKGSIFQILYSRYVPRLGHNQTIGIIAHKLCRLVWKILHRAIRYEERGPEVRKESKQKRTRKMIRELRKLGYRIEPSASQSATTA